MTEAKQTPVNQTALWSTLQAFQVDQPGTQFTFVKRLARENRWSTAYAQRVFEEYKRFIFLAATASHPVTPSDEVDQAWHLHLAYTRSYWDELCGQVLQQAFHHGPTKGGQAEDEKFKDWYTRTLISYERMFGEQPPTDIWPAPAKRFAAKLRFARLNTSDYWLLRKPQAVSPKAAGLIASALLSSLTITACSIGSMNGGFSIALAGAVLFLFVVTIGWLSTKFSRSTDQRQRQQDGSGCGAGGCGSSGCSSSDSDGGNSDSSSDSGGGDGGSSGCGSSGCGGGGCGGGGCSS